MKKICLAIFWGAQYVLGIGVILAMQRNVPVLPILLGIASLLAPYVGGKLLGISPELKEEADNQVPGFADAVWKLGLVLSVLIVVLSSAKRFPNALHLPVTRVHAVILIYAAALFRDLFLMRFYFGRGFGLAGT